MHFKPAQGLNNRPFAPQLVQLYLHEIMQCGIYVELFSFFFYLLLHKMLIEGWYDTIQLLAQTCQPRKLKISILWVQNQYFGPKISIFHRSSDNESFIEMG